MTEKDVVPTAVAHAPLPSLGPVAPQERIEDLDILRGFALFGILIVNITHYLYWFTPYESHTDEAAGWLVGFFGEDKFYRMFSFLFGVGFAILLSRAQARQTPFLGVYLRRLTVLFLIGVAFYVFVEHEQILFIYAMLGAPLLLFRRRSPRTLLAWAMVFLVFAPVMGPLQTAVRQTIPAWGVGVGDTATERAARYQGDGVLLEEARITGDYRTLVAVRARRLFLWPLTFLEFLIYWPSIFAMFLLGLYAHRRGLFSELDANWRFVRQALCWSVAGWVTVTFVVRSLVGPTIYVTPWLPLGPEIPTTSWLTYLPIQALGNTALTMIYITAVVLLLRWGAARRLLTLLGWTGRMGLTNYVLHFVIVITIFHGYGLGLHYGVGPAMGPAFAILVTLAAIPLSVWWLRRFRFGPLEWVWRSLTYGRRQPMLIEMGKRSAAPVPYLRAAVAAIVVLTMGLAFVVWEPAERRRADEAEIAKLEAEWRSALLSRDTAALARIATTNYRMGTGNPLEITHLPQLMQSIASRTLIFDAITSGRVKVNAHENTASAIGIETQVVSLRRGSVGGERRYVHWYVKRDGRWRLRFSYLARV